MDGVGGVNELFDCSSTGGTVLINRGALLPRRGVVSGQEYL